MKKTFLLLALLSMLDGVLTYLGIQLGLIQEANLLMKLLIMYDPIIFIGIKLVLSICLVAMAIMIKAPKSNIIKQLSYLALFIYGGIFLLHSYWIFLSI
ncbi:DUF5658 family protein [Bacillus sp. 2205SS5-2]|uniref:DUF5658 family protein n=1 Tax=Bacillus sp. 2205SS5-2 TaxID=3109031 RepID=UPI003003BA9A